MKYYAVSDIHGCPDAPKDAMAGLSGDSRLVLLGDYIDCGPRSGGVLQYVYELQQRHGVYFDGESHYCIDGSVQDGGRLNVLAWDEDSGEYTAL